MTTGGLAKILEGTTDTSAFSGAVVRMAVLSMVAKLAYETDFKRDSNSTIRHVYDRKYSPCSHVISIRMTQFRGILCLKQNLTSYT